MNLCVHIENVDASINTCVYICMYILNIYIYSLPFQAIFKAKKRISLTVIMRPLDLHQGAPPLRDIYSQVFICMYIDIGISVSKYIQHCQHILKTIDKYIRIDLYLCVSLSKYGEAKGIL